VSGELRQSTVVASNIRSRCGRVCDSREAQPTVLNIGLVLLAAPHAPEFHEEPRRDRFDRGDDSPPLSMMPQPG
jgi:hypothetical protein